MGRPCYETTQQSKRASTLIGLVALRPVLSWAGILTMNRSLGWIITLALVGGFVRAESPGTSSKSELVQHLEAIFYDPSFAKIPTNHFKAEDYGDEPDGSTVNTKAIQAAIDAAHRTGGGVVTLPQGTSVSGALFLKSNVELRLDEGVVLQAVQDDAEYPELWTRVAGIEMQWPCAFINVNQAENVRLTGKGIIDGNGQYWWDKFEKLRGSYRARGLRWAQDYDAKRVRALVIDKSTNVLLKDFTIQRSGFWTIQTLYSDRVHISGVIIRNNIGGSGPSTDGVDVDSSRNVLIEKCDIDCNDDSFAMKAGRDYDGLRVNRPTENVVIRHCVTGRGGGLAIGSETSGGINHIEMYGMKATRTGCGLHLKSAKNRGGVLRDIWIHDMEMEEVGVLFKCELNWFPQYSVPPRPKAVPESEWPAHWRVLQTPVEPPERGLPTASNIRLSNITFKKGRIAIQARGLESRLVRDVTFENIKLDAKQGGSIENAADWTFRNVDWNIGTPVEMKNCLNIELPKRHSAFATGMFEEPRPSQ